MSNLMCPLLIQFLLVLFAAMASFAQMWVSLTFEPHQSESEIYMEGYLKAYTMMVSVIYPADLLKMRII